MHDPLLLPVVAFGIWYENIIIETVALVKMFLKIVFQIAEKKKLLEKGLTDAVFGGIILVRYIPKSRKKGYKT